MNFAPKLIALPSVTPPVANDNFGGTYERDEKGVIQAQVPDFSECESDADRDSAIAFTQLANQQYTIVHDNFGSVAAEKTNYGWVQDDGLLCSKMRSKDGYSTITTTYDEDYVVTRHFIVIIGDDGENGPETDYVAGNASIALAA